MLMMHGANVKIISHIIGCFLAPIWRKILILILKAVIPFQREKNAI